VQSSRVLAGTGKLLATLCGLQFEISPHSFFQTNTAQAGRLYDIAVQAAAEVVGTGTGGVEGAADQAAAAAARKSLGPGNGDPGNGRMSRDAGVVLDLYCGTGTIALCLASALPGRQVVGFDVSSAAIADAQANAARNGLRNVDFVCGDLNQLLPSSQGGMHPSKHSSRQQEQPGGSQKPQHQADAAADQHSEQPGVQSLQSLRPSVVVVDPARAGLGQGVVQYLLRCGAKRVVYVSCNAATQARDLQLLCGSGVFRMTSWVCVDLFPQTDVAHVETVVVLDRVV
jgi:tRNA/tmRNA/rRNA uracil-C5-methylase (TrmA/RlmC/RlmD family)